MKWCGSILFLALAVAACGGGPLEEIDSKRDTNNSGDSLFISKATRSIQASGSFQPLGLSVKAGQRLKIRSTGMVTVGLLDASDPTNIHLKYYDADGGDHYAYNNQTMQWELVSSNINFNCGISLGQSVRNRRADGTIETIPSPISTVGPCCSAQARGMLPPQQFPMDLIQGQPLFFMEANRCVADAKVGSLIMKVVPSNKRADEVAPVLVGRNYENAPFAGETDGELYFAVNDVTWIADNQGSFNVTVEIAP